MTKHELLCHIAEVDRRRLYLEMAFPSLFAFATGFLGYSKSGGRRCASTHQLELHHLVPFARGGAATIARSGRVRQVDLSP